MQIQQILGEHGAQKEVCNGGSCPAAIIADNGNAYVQGYIDPEANSQIDIPSNEAIVRIPLPVLKKIAAQVIEA